MNVSVEKNDLLKITQNSQKALSNKSTLPVLNGIFLEAKEGFLTSYCTDLEIAIKDKTECSIKKEGKVVVYGNLLVDLIKNLDEGRVDLSLDEKDNKLIIRSNKSQFNLNTLPIEDFPPFPATEEGNTIKMKNPDFIDAIRQVVSASSRDDSRPVLGGLLFEVNGGGKTQIVATDSYRLSLKELKTDPEKIDSSLVVPRRAVEEIIKIIPKEGNTKMVFSENQVSFETGGAMLVSRLIGGQYPNHEQLFPKEFGVEATINREEFLQSAKRMALLSPTAPIILKVSGDKIVTSSKSADIGSGQETIDIKGKTKDMEVAFNSRYLIDGLSVLADKEVIIQLVDSFQPGLIKGVKTKEYQYLIMPVRIN